MTDPAPIVTVEMTDVRVVEPERAALPAGSAAPPRPRTRWLGVIALGVVVLSIGFQAAAIVVASGQDAPGGTVLAWIAIALSGLGALVGIAAAILGRGRSWGIAAAVLAVLTNPFLLLQLLRVLS